MLQPLTTQQRMDLEEATQRYAENVDSCAAFLQARGISRSTAVTYRLGSVPTSEGSWIGGRLAIPAMGPRGVYSLRFRCLQAHSHSDPEVSCQKYLGFPGIGTRLFNVQAVHKAHDQIEITEGELDALILLQLGYNAVGVPGAHNWKHHYARVFAGFDTVRVWGDGDEAGREFSRVVTSAIGPAGRTVKMPDGMDVNELFLAQGANAIHERVEEYNNGNSH